MISRALAVAALLALSPAAWCAEEVSDEGPVDARIAKAEGVVFVFQADQPDEGIPAEEDMVLEAGDKVKTGADGRVELAFDGHGMFEVGPKAEFTVSSLQREEPSFDLAFGSVLAKFKSMFARRGRLVVKTPHAVAAVRGTEFGIEVGDDDGETHVAVFDEGRVGVSGTEGGEETLLEANHETKVRRGGPPDRAARLQRFIRHRQHMTRMRARHAAIGKAWRRMPPGQRRELRQELRERFRNMPPEERERFRKRAQEMHRFKQERRERLQDQREGRKERLRDELERRRERRQDGREGKPRGERLRDEREGRPRHERRQDEREGKPRRGRGPRRDGPGGPK